MTIQIDNSKSYLANCKSLEIVRHPDGKVEQRDINHMCEVICDFGEFVELDASAVESSDPLYQKLGKATFWDQEKVQGTKREVRVPYFTEEQIANASG